MSHIPAHLKYTKDHEWALIEGNIATVGITDYAQHELGDIVYVELPEKGALVQKGEPFGEIEAVKTVASLYSPVSGKVAEANPAIADSADTINSEPYGKGWIIKITMSDPTEIAALLSPEQYKELI
jgi:glycine cleavage system H protein